MAHIHSVQDADIHYKIDGLTRTITNVNETKRMLVQNDHNSERLTFEVPRFVDGHDLLTCNVVQIHYVNSDVYEKKFSSGVYEVDDLGIKNATGEGANIAVLTWLVSGNATKYVGTLNFVIRFSCVSGEGIVEYAWNTTIFKGIEILEGIFNTKEVVERNVDVLEQWKQGLIATGIEALVLDKTLLVEGEAADAKAAGDKIMQLSAQKVDGAYVEENYLYLTSNEEVVVGPIGPFTSGTGSGGGGSSNEAKMKLTNTSGWLLKTVGYGSECPITFNWTSIENDLATGNGVLKIIVNGATKEMKDIPQGDVTVDVAKYLSAGSNLIRVNVSDVYGNSRTINYSVNAISISLESNFDYKTVYSEDIAFTYTPTGDVTKIMHFILDGKEIGTEEVTVSGRQRTFNIPAQSHGTHLFKVYFEAEVNEETITSEPLYYDIMCKEEGNEEVLISCVFNKTKVEQYAIIPFTYIVYDPMSLTTPITWYEGDESIKELTVDRTEQVFNYFPENIGEVTVSINAKGTVKEYNLNVTESSVKIEAETDSLSLYLSSQGRSNNEENPGVWSWKDTEVTFSGFNYVSDGWQNDEQGNTVLRVSGDARLEIPTQIFAKDFRTTGKTIEVLFAAREVLDYEAVIMSCLSGDRGFWITSKNATLKSEQSQINAQFKEDEVVRMTFVVEKKSDNRLIQCYVNGIMSGCIQYPDDDDFSQSTPVNISIGSNDCTMDIYCIRIYDNNLTRYQILDNWIADIPNLDNKMNAFKHNNIYDAYGSIIIDKLPKDLPYLVLEAAELPQFKGDKKTCSGYYVDPVNPNKSFTFTNAEIDVQGTSSQYYYVKNYKIKFKGGFILTDGTSVEVYQMKNDSIPTNVFTMKADVASSEGANNVVLAQLYNELCPVNTPPQEDDIRVRQTIDGHPIVIFWDKGDGAKFVGKYNFNNDKATEEVFGFSAGDESWEILQNGTDRVGFKSADFSGNDWKNDFEARYPEDNVNIANLAEFSAWVVSTDPDQATGNALATTITYDGVNYTLDTAEYRLAKYKNELSNHASVDALVFYYVFTEVFLCIDQREKNAFPTLFDALKLWMVLFYDADSSLGTDNKGNLAFDFYLEDIDYTEAGDPVFNGQNSVLWSNLRKTFYDKILAEYTRLRTELRTDGSGQPLLSYDVVDDKFENHQNKWPEAIFNEDAYKKCLEPLIKAGDGLYLPMLQGKKEQHRKWWLYNRFRYLDSKYVTGTSMTNRITIRAHAKNNIFLTSFVNMYGHVYYNAEMVEHRMVPGEEYEFEWAATGAEDAVIGINDADMLTSLGDLSSLMVELIDVSKAVHLTHLKVGDASADYENNNLNSVTHGNNILLRTVDYRNCKSLATAVDISGCTNIEEAYFDGTSITGLSLPNGGILKTLHLPETVTNLTIRNQTKITDFTMPSYANITTLRLENVSDVVDNREILESIPANSRVRLIGFNWNFDTEEEIYEMLAKLDSMRGLDENGNNVDNAQMMGTFNIDVVKSATVLDVKAKYPSINVAYESLSVSIYYYNHDGSELVHTESFRAGADGTYTGTVDRENTDRQDFIFTGWSATPNGEADANVLKNVTEDRRVYASYDVINYAYLSFYNNDGSTLLQKSKLVVGSNGTYTNTTPTLASTAQYTYSFSGWSTTIGGASDANALKNVTEDRSVYAYFTATVRTYKVYFYNGDTLLQTIENVPYGGSATYIGDNPVNNTTGNPDDFTFTGWSPSPTNINGDTYCYAVFMDKREITDSWETIIANVDNGTAATKYSVGMFKTMDMGAIDLPYDFYAGSAVIYNNEIHILGGESYNQSHYKWNGTSWIEVSTLPYYFYAGSAVVYNGEIHLLGGSSYMGKGYGTYHYKWNGIEWTSVSTLPYEYSYGCAFLYNDEIHILSSNSSNYNACHYKWDGTSWTQVSTLPYSMSYKNSIVYNDRIYIFGGTKKNGSNSYVGCFEWTGDEWIELKNTPENFSNGSILIYDDEVYAISSSNKYYKWDFVSWTDMGAMPFECEKGKAIVFNNEIHVLGCDGSSNAKKHYIYSPDTDKWTPNGVTESIPMQIAGINHDAYPEGVGKWEVIGTTYSGYFERGSAVEYNGELHLLGSFYSTSNYTNHYKWNGSAWIKASTLPYNFYQANAHVIDNEIHILSSGNNKCFDKHYKWDGTTWTVVSTLPVNKQGTSLYYNNELHLFYCGSLEHYKFDFITKTWILESTLPSITALSGTCFVGYDNKLHMLGGNNNTNNHYVYDTETSTWILSGTKLPYSFKDGSAVVWNNEIHIMGGGYANGASHTYDHYKWNGVEWTKEADLVAAVSVVTVYNDKITSCGGVSTSEQRILQLNTTDPKATLTFIAKNVLGEERPYVAGGSKCWSESDLRTYLNGDGFIASLPSALQTGIKTVDKISLLKYDSQELVTSQDKVWIPSLNELGIFGSFEAVNGMGEQYAIFSDAQSRKRGTVGDESAYQAYWTRTDMNHLFDIYKIDKYGYSSSASKNGTEYVLIGFCL